MSLKNDKAKTEAVKRPEMITSAGAEAGMTKMEKEEFKDRIKAMSLEEMELALDVIPVELCLARVNRELDRLKTFESSVKTAVNG